MTTPDTWSEENSEQRRLESASAEARTARRQENEARAAGDSRRAFDCKLAARRAQDLADRLERSMAGRNALPRGRSR